MDKPKYCSKLTARACVLNNDDVSLEKLQAAKTRYEADASLENRGKFPVGLVSQPDILALQSVILTTGRPGNLNDDVMLNEEVLPILWTAKFKPFNMEHTKFIIGCMFDAFAINRETGKVVAGIERFDEDESDEDRENERNELQSVIANLPENLDIITNQVLWALHFKEQVREVKRKAIAGEIFVSMEIWFVDYDYLVGNRIVKRTPLLAEALDSKLRINGGSGFLGVDRVRRVPRNLIFAGNAAVETPANPDSFILDVMDRSDLMDKAELVEEVEAVEASTQSVQQMIADNTLRILEGLSDEADASNDLSDVGDAGRSGLPLGSDAYGSELASAEVGEVVNTVEESTMTEDKKVVELLEKNAVLQNDHDKAVAELAEANKDKEGLQTEKEELEAKLEETLALLKEKEDALVEKAEAFEKLEAEKTELDGKLEETSAELAEIEEARRLDVRKAVLTGLGLSEERVIKTLAKTAELDAEAFDAEVEDLKAFMTELTPVVDLLAETPEEEAPEEVAEVEEVEAEVEEAPEVEEVEATEEELEEVLEEVEEEETPVAEAIGTVNADEETEETDQIQSAMAKALGISL
jgi:hypothetical protein